MKIFFFTFLPSIQKGMMLSEKPELIFSFKGQSFFTFRLSQQTSTSW
jgi:hypothetical protein